MDTKSDKDVWHIDKMVMTVFVGLIIVSSAIVGFKIYRYEPCPGVNFEVQKYNLRVGEVIHFNDLTEGVEKRVWDFGDSTEGARVADPMHIYSRPGEYTVKLMVNDQCFDYKTIVIKNPVPVVDERLIPSFAAPAKAVVGERVRFNDLTDGATSWEWRFGESGGVDATVKNPGYTFKQAGRVKVSLIVNGDMRYIAEKTVKVLPKTRKKKRRKPPEKPKEELYIPESPEEYVEYTPEDLVEPEEPAVQYLSDDDLLILIKDIAERRQKKDVIDPYLCVGIDKSVVKANGEMIRFNDFLERIDGKQLKVRSLYSFRDHNQCIVRIEIKYRAKIF